MAKIEQSTRLGRGLLVLILVLLSICSQCTPKETSTLLGLRLRR